MTSAQILWFLLIGVLFSGFFFSKVLISGVRMAVRFFGRNTAERDTIIKRLVLTGMAMKSG